MPSLEEEIRMDGRIHMRGAPAPDRATGVGRLCYARRIAGPRVAVHAVGQSDLRYRCADTERGSLPKVIGQHAAVTNPGTTDVVVDFVPSGVEGVRCNSGVDDPKNGKFVAVKVSAKTAADPQNLLPRVIFGTGWESVSRDGESLVASTVQAASCTYDAPNELKPNRSYHFDVVLDVPQSTAGVVVVFDPVRNLDLGLRRGSETGGPVGGIVHRSARLRRRRHRFPEGRRGLARGGADVFRVVGEGRELPDRGQRARGHRLGVRSDRLAIVPAEILG
ncbi:MAG: hypothetical protein JWR81_5566 [Pseudonocardia sp.]|nr:hypothetical protein [Pseudonocardia sp.]